jgi:amino acid adenylation domain-containing protein
MSSIKLGMRHRVLLDRMLGDEGSSKIPRRPAGLNRAPLSFGQQRLWFLDQFQPGLPLYTMLGAVRFPAPCDVNAVRRAIDEVVRRHESLRTVFQSAGDHPEQVILPPHPAMLEVSNLRGADVRAAARFGRGVFQRETRKPFDLATGPLFRAHLLQLPGDHDLLMFSVHHIVSDGWSMALIRKDIEACYAAIMSGLPIPNDATRLQFADFAIWQRKQLQDEDVDRLRRYWREALGGARPVSLPTTDHPAPPVETGIGANLSFRLSADLAQSATALGRQADATLFMVLLAGLTALFYHHGGERDWVIGTPAANRETIELESVVGFLVNTLPIRIRLDPQASFRALLQHVREQTLLAFDHQALPFDQIVEAVGPQRNLSHNPLFQVMFALQNLPDRQATQDEAAGGGEPAVPEESVARFGQGWFLAPNEDHLIGSVEYSMDLYDHDRITRMIEQYRRLLCEVTENPDLPVEQIELLADAERATLTRWSDGPSTPHEPMALHDFFERTTAAVPDRPALCVDDVTLTYGELNQRAEVIASVLFGMRIGIEDRVAICMGRSAWTQACVIGVLKAGATCLPLDPTLPDRRKNLMIEDAQARVVLTEPPVPLAGVKCQRLDVGDHLVAGSRPPIRIHPAQLAYVIYTSGSTGRPKGVALSHAALINLICWQLQSNDTDAAARTVQFAPLGFDVAFQEMFATFAAGGCLCVVPDDIRADTERLAAWMIEQRVTRAFLPPLVLRELAAAPPADLPVRQIITAGEALQITPAIAQLCRRSRIALTNQYGPTETHVATWHPLDGNPAQWPTRPPIGRPIANHRAYVLSADFSPVPIGVPGELYLAGDGLARGYLGQAALTAERFLPNPFGTPGSRMYRTGDVARWLGDGTLEFLGRSDSQVKVRGFRIELGEVEAVLRTSPGVGEAAVGVRRDPATGDATLVGFYETSTKLDPGRLRAHLRENVPEYMVPSLLVETHRLPRLANGKIDRRSLPTAHARAAREVVPPRTECEERLAAIWTGVLHIEAIGVEDNFFELGGHSLLATQVVSRVRRELGSKATLRDLFEAPTIAAFANRIDSLGSLSSLPANGPASESPASSSVGPLSFAQERLWFLHRLSPESSTYNLGEVVRFDGAYVPAALASAWQRLAERHPGLRTRFVETAEGPTQKVMPAEPLAARLVNLEEVAPSMRESELYLIRRREREHAIGLGDGPPLRAVVAVLSPTEHVLVLTMHHIIVDGWSLGILAGELAVLYHAERAGQPATLPLAPPPPIEFCRRQRQDLTAEVADDEIAYWRRTLAGAPSEINLPFDYPRSREPFGPGALQTFFVAPDIRAGLTAIARNENASLFMVLLAAFAAMLARYDGGNDFPVGIPVGNRDHTEFERTIGFFVNTVVVRIVPPRRCTFRGLVRHVRDRFLAAQSHQNIPFERLVQELRPSRETGVHPLFHVMFFFNQGPIGGAGELEFSSAPDELDSDIMRVEEVDAKFDLTLGFEDGPQGLAGAFEYRSDLFADSTIWRMLQLTRRLLAACAQAPDQRLEQLQLATDEELKFALEVLGRASDPAMQTVEGTLGGLVAAAVERHPDRVAIEWGAESFTYRDLWRQSSALAHDLRARGLQRDAIVGVLMPRSPDLIMTIVAILLAGGAYLMIDPGLPTRRKHAMLNGVWGVVAMPGESLDLPEHVLVIDSRPGVSAPRGARRPSVDPRQAAYVIYTSGSTGEPRGVVVEHRAAARYVSSAAAQFGLTAASRVLQFASTSFDVAVEEIFATLSVGATLVMRTDDMLNSMHEFLSSCNRIAVDVLILPTAFWHELMLELAESSLPPRVKLVVIGGEQANASDLANWYRSVPRDVRLINAYGPTETTVSATYAELTIPLLRHPRPPIGRPVEGACAYVLDECLLPAPLGVPGELYIGGLMLARGYRDDPAETAARFIPDPFGPPGSRMYRTRDRAMLRGDGLLTFVNRIDDQVKVRGFRVEVGEVEAALRSISGVAVAAVAHRPLVGDLVAAVQTTGGDLRESDLLSELAFSLPSYMVPSHIVFVPAVPLTVGGKPDRCAVAALTGHQSLVQGQEPRDAREAVVAEIWARVLGVAKVSREDDFFNLGGHSLLATRVVTRLREHFGVEISVRNLFEARTVAALAASLPDLRVIDAAPKLDESGLENVPRRASREPAPVSFAQERLLFIHRLTGGAPLYNLPVVLPFRGPFNPAAMRSAIALLFERHDVLRTRFVESGGESFQVLGEGAETPMDFLDLRDVPASQREAELSRIADAEARQQFDLERGRVARALLVRTADDDHTLLFTLHHIAGDGWSVNIIRRELTDSYNVFAVGAVPDLPALPMTYTDYSVWQRRRFAPHNLRGPVAWWVQELGGAPEHLPMPLDRQRGTQRDFEGRWQLFSVAVSQVGRLQRLARGSNASLFMVLMAAFQIALARWTGTNDIVVGTPLAGRDRVAAEGLVGNFVNTLPIRTKIEWGRTFRDILARVRETTLNMHAHADVPFERLVEEVRPQRALEISPIFQVVLALQNLPLSTVGHLEIPEGSSELVGTCTAKFDLSVSIDVADERLVGYVEYACDIFKEDTIRRFVAGFTRLLGIVADNPDAIVSDLSLTTPEDRLRLISDWAIGPSAAEEDQDVIEGIVHWANIAPHATAVCERDAVVTYAELARRAGSIAAGLKALGVRRESVVAVRMPRSIAFVIACTGVLWAGAAFIPIDPLYPPAHAKFLIADSGAVLVLESETVTPVDAVGVLSLRMSAAGHIIGQATPRAVLPHRGHAEQLAYVIYTSGSTGTPKGVGIPHRGLRNLCRWYRDRLDLNFRDRASLTSSPGFDGTVSEIWPTLVAGATLDICDDETKLAPDALAAWLHDRGITVAFLVTPLAEAYMNAAWPGAKLRWLLTGGDQLTRRPPADARYRLFNQYGPAECSVCATATEVPSEGSGVPPIGTPIGGARCYVLDAALNPVPPGVAGEVYLAGAGAGRGYLGRPDLTAGAFLPDPFGSPGSRMYATGDRARWDDGMLYFLGRRDRQVKLRGIRIELSEIELTLAEISGGPAAVRVGLSGALIGYVTCGPAEASIALATLRERLPAHIVPARLIALATLPTTTHGKIDDEALRQLEAPVQSTELALLNAVERQIAAQWSELLRSDNFSPGDDFFAQGGHSLLLTQLMTRLRAEFGIEIPLRVLFQRSTLEEMAIEVLVTLIESLPASMAETALAAGDGGETVAHAVP